MTRQRPRYVRSVPRARRLGYGSNGLSPERLPGLAPAQRRWAFLFGRFTYEIFAGSWGTIADMKATPIGAALNGRPKYLVSTSLTNPEWADTTVLRGDLATAIRDLKEQNDGKLVVPGSISLVRCLLANDLIDQIDLLTYPIVVGQGIRLFPESGPDIALHLLDSRTTAGGVTI